MRGTRKLQSLGQSIWLDNITRDLLTNGTLARYIDEFHVTGLTSNPTIFEQAIKRRLAYDEAKVERDAVFGFDIVTECPGVPKEILTPRSAWSDPKAYDATARKLAELFRNNFKTYEPGATPRRPRRGANRVIVRRRARDSMMP